MAWQTFLLLLVTTMNNINAQIVHCTGGDATCSCPNTAPTPGATCILDCATEDICKEKVLNCRTGDPCEILCEAKASCSEGVRINSNRATDVSIVCSSEDACKDDMEIFCGTGHCRLQCDKSTSCENWGFVDVSLSTSFFCVGACPNNLPSKTVLPSITPTNPTINPTESPTLQTPSPTATPTRSPTPITISPTTSPTHNPTASPTNNPTNIPTPAPTNNPTQSPTNYPTNIPTVTPTKNPTLSPSYNPTNVPTVTPTNYPTLSPSYSPTNNSTVTLSSETVKATEYPTSLITTQTLLPTLNPSESSSDSSTESTSASTSTIEANLTVTLSESDANPIRAHQSATNEIDTMSAILIVLAVGFAIISAILGWLLCSKDKQRKHKKLKVFQGGHVSRAGEASHKNEFSTCPSKSPSTYTKSIKSVYSTNDPRLSSVLETGGSNEGSSESSSSSDDMYRNKAEQCGGFPVTGQDSVSTPFPPAPIHCIASNSTRGYIHARPQQYYYTAQPYVHNMIQHHNNAPLHKAPSLQSSVGVSYSYNYMAGMQSIVSPISPISPPPDLPSISRYDENGDILPVIPGQTERCVDSDGDDEYSHASVTSDAASKLSSNSVKNANDGNLETVVCLDLDGSIPPNNGIGANKLYAE